MLMKKVATIGKVGYLTTSILNGEEVQRQPALENDLTNKRAAMVAEARAWAEEHRPKASGKSGRTRKRRQDSGDGADGTDSTVQPAQRAVRPAKGTTYETTYALAKAGFSLDQIAAERSMAKSTIEGHFARGIAEGALDIDGLIPGEERDTLADWMRENPDKGLNDARANFGDRFSYGQLRMVQAWVKKEA